MTHVRAVVDRFEGDKAVILVGDEQKPLVVDRQHLPQGTREGHWLRAELCGDVFISAELDEQQTERARARIARKLDQLRRGQHRPKR